MTILIAEDDPNSKLLLERLVQKQRHQYISVFNGQDAISVYEKEAVDLILLDIQMPVINGVEVIKMIRKKEEKTQQHVPVIVVTAYAMKGDKERFIEIGADDYLSKPIKKDDFLKLIIKYG